VPPASTEKPPLPELPPLALVPPVDRPPVPAEPPPLLEQAMKAKKKATAKLVWFLFMRWSVRRRSVERLGLEWTTPDGGSPMPTRLT
jgi:hypothetical protein